MGVDWVFVGSSGTQQHVLHDGFACACLQHAPGEQSSAHTGCLHVQSQHHILWHTPPRHLHAHALPPTPSPTPPTRRAGPHPLDDTAAWPIQGPLKTCVTGETVIVRRAPDLPTLETHLQAVYEQGIRSVAVVFKHAAIFPDHELLVGQLAEDMGFTQVSLSSQVMQMVKMVPRGYTATADAYLTPHIMRYVCVCDQGGNGLHRWGRAPRVVCALVCCMCKGGGGVQQHVVHVQTCISLCVCLNTKQVY